MRLLYYICLFSFPVTTLAQSPKKVVRNTVSDPVYFIDSVRVDKAEMMKYNPEQIATVSAYKDTTATKLLGDAGKYGIIYIETNSFASNRYQRYLMSKSAAYRQALGTSKTDSTLQYILNGKPLRDKFEGTLSLIDDSVFKKLSIVDGDVLRKKYGILDKTHGVIIESGVPHDLYHGKKKF